MLQFRILDAIGYFYAIDSASVALCFVAIEEAMQIHTEHIEVMVLDSGEVTEKDCFLQLAFVKDHLARLALDTPAA